MPPTRRAPTRGPGAGAWAATWEAVETSDRQWCIVLTIAGPPPLKFLLAGDIASEADAIALADHVKHTIGDLPGNVPLPRAFVPCGVCLHSPDSHRGQDCLECENDMNRIPKHFYNV